MADQWPFAARRTTAGQRQRPWLTPVAVAILLLPLAWFAWGAFGLIELKARELYEDDLLQLERLSTVSEAFAVTVVDAVHKGAQGLLDTDEATADLVDAQQVAEKEWAAFLARLSPEHHTRLLDEAQARLDVASREVDTLIREARTGGRPAFERFDGELFDTIDPLTITLRDLRAEVRERASERAAAATAALDRLRNLSVATIAAAGVFVLVLVVLLARTGRLADARRRRLQALLDDSPDPVVRLDRWLRHVYVNRAAEAAWGSTREQMLGRTSRELGMPDALADEWEATLREVLDDGGVGVMELHLPGPDGTRTFESRVAPERDDRGHVVGLLATIRDLTDRVRSEQARRDREEQYRALAEASPDFIGRYDRDLRLVYVNTALERSIGRPREEILGRSSAELGDPPDLTALWERAEREVFETGEEQAVEFVSATAHGDRWFESRITPEFGPDAAVEHIVFVSRDITDLKVAQDELRARLTQQEAVAQLASSALRANDLDGLFDQAVRRVATMLDVPLVKILEREDEGAFRVRAGVGWRDGTVGETRVVGGQAAYTLTSGGPVLVTDSAIEERFPLEPLLADHGVRCGMSAPISTPGRAYGVIGVHTTRSRAFTDDDVVFVQAVAGILGSAIGRVEAETAMRAQALRDPLTGLANRTLLLDHTEHALAKLSRRDGIVAVLFLDLDNFKLVNDSLGHEVGDKILIEIAGRLRHAVRPTDTVARFGGDEFVVLCEDLDSAEEATGVAARVLGTMAEPYHLGGRLLQMTASLGVATATAPVDASELLHGADIAMYRAKERGRDRIEVFDDQLREQAVRRLELQLDMREALEHGEFRLLYQPKVAVDGWSIVGVEALLRWEHPTRGLLGPAAFLPVAEDTGLIAPIGAWVRSEAILQLAAWDRRGLPLPELAVNLSSRDLADPGLVEEITALLSVNDIERHRLCVEVTETAIMHDIDAARATLEGLSEIGVTIALDDFGTGYSSLRHLHELPVDSVKIDRSFIVRLGHGPARTALVAGALAMVRTMGLDAVAEGVETTGQLRALERLGCPVVQGYLFSKPVPPGALEALLADGVIVPSTQPTATPD